MPKEQGNPEANKPNPSEVVNGLLAKLGIPPTPPAGCASVSAGSATVGCGRASDVENQHSEGVAGVGSASQTDVANQQLATAAEASQTGGVVGGSVVVDCRYCPGGCCGGLSGRRLPRRVVELLRVVKVALGLRHECEVVNRYPELFCRRLGRLGHGLGRVKELERLLSREGEYKSSYVLGRLAECRSDAVCWRYLRLGVEGWFRVVHLLANREPGGVDAYFARLVRGLGFSGVVEFARYLRLVVQFLVDFNYVNRGRGYRDALSVRCRICGRVIDATGPLPGVLFTIVRHFRVGHGLAGPGDVEAKAAELGSRIAEYDDARARVLKGIGDVLLLLRLVVHRLEQFGHVERFGRQYRCRICNADVGGVVDVVTHFTNHHLNVLRSMRFSTSPSEECEPGEIGADETADPGTLTYRLACALRRQFGVRGPWYGEAERLLSKLRGGLACSEVALANAGFEPAGRYMEALREAGICF